MRLVSRRAGIALSAFLAAFVLSAAYTTAQRASGDVTLLGFALEQSSGAAVLVEPSSDLSRSMGEIVMGDQALNLFLMSDSAVRMPEAATAIRNADAALDGAFELMRLEAGGVSAPTFQQAPRVAEAVSLMPRLTDEIACSGDAEVIDNSEGRAIIALRSALDRELAAAQEMIESRP